MYKWKMNLQLSFDGMHLDLSITNDGQKDGSLHFLTKLLLSALAVSLVAIGVLVFYIVSRKWKRRITVFCSLNSHSLLRYFRQLQFDKFG